MPHFSNLSLKFNNSRVLDITLWEENGKREREIEREREEVGGKEGRKEGGKEPGREGRKEKRKKRYTISML